MEIKTIKESSGLPFWQAILFGTFLFLILFGWLACLIAGSLVNRYDPVIGRWLFLGGIAQLIFSLLLILTYFYKVLKYEYGGEDARSEAKKKKPIWRDLFNCILLFSGTFGWWVCLIAGSLLRHNYGPGNGGWLIDGGIAQLVLSFSLWPIYFIYKWIQLEYRMMKGGSEASKTGSDQHP